MKVIVLVKHECHIDDSLKVYAYSEDNLRKVKDEMREFCPIGKEQCLGDLPRENGGQFGRNENDYCSYSIVEVKE